ncbi:MAG: hypothetical protein ACRDZX_14625 [Acidimicrobiales bacterium]
MRPLDAGRGDHPPVAHHHDVSQPEALAAELGDVAELFVLAPHATFWLTDVARCTSLS